MNPARPAFTDAELAELRLMHARMQPVFRRIAFERVMADPVLRGCLLNTLEAHKRRAALLKAHSAREAAQFELTP